MYICRFAKCVTFLFVDTVRVLRLRHWAQTRNTPQQLLLIKQGFTCQAEKSPTLRRFSIVPGHGVPSTSEKPLRCSLWFYPGLCLILSFVLPFFWLPLLTCLRPGSDYRIFKILTDFEIGLHYTHKENLHR